MVLKLILNIDVHNRTISYLLQLFFFSALVVDHMIISIPFGLQVGTPICIPSKDFIDIGKIASIEINGKKVDTAIKGLKVAIKVMRITIAHYCDKMIVFHL